MKSYTYSNPDAAEAISEQISDLFETRKSVAPRKGGKPTAAAAKELARIDAEINALQVRRDNLRAYSVTAVLDSFEAELRVFIDLYAKRKAEFIQAAHADPARAIRWGQSVVAAETQAELAEQLINWLGEAREKGLDAAGIITTVEKEQWRILRRVEVQPTSSSTFDNATSGTINATMQHWAIYEMREWLDALNDCAEEIYDAEVKAAQAAGSVTAV